MASHRLTRWSFISITWRAIGVGFLAFADSLHRIRKHVLMEIWVRVFRLVQSLLISLSRQILRFMDDGRIIGRRRRLFYTSGQSALMPLSPHIELLRLVL